MRIAMFMPGLSPSSLGWGVHHDFAEAVRGLGHEFEILTTEADGTGRTRTLPVAERWLRLGRVCAPIFRTPGLLPSALALARHLRSSGDAIDLLHVEVAYPHGAAALLAARWAGWRGPIAVTPMGEDVLVLREAHYGFRRHLGPRLLVKRTLRRAAAVRCISGIVTKAIQPLRPSLHRAVVPLNVGADTMAAANAPPDEARARRAAARARCDAELGAAGRPLVLALGRLHPFKGIATLVDAMARLSPEALLVVAGPSLAGKELGDVRTVLERRAHDAGLGERVRFVGALDPARALDALRAADVLVVPSLLESLNKVCVEAAAVGTPFVVTSTTGIAEWLPPHGVGVVVPPRDPDTLAHAIARVLAGEVSFDPAQRQRFVARFEPRRIAAEVLALYRGAVPSLEPRSRS